MKKYYYLTLILAISLLQSCTNESELIFEKSASERMTEALNNYNQLLQAAPNGWVMQYYPQSSQAYGGYNLYFQFTNGEVTVKSDVQSPLLSTNEATSTYSLGEDMGPTLNFDSYNEVLNFFSNPALAVGGGAGFGYEGDYEFVFMSGNANEVILRGKKTKNTIRLTPLPTSTTWEEYCDDVDAMIAKFAASGCMNAYTMTVNNLEELVMKDPAYNRLSISYLEDEKVVSVDMSYVVSPSGIRFHEPLTINGITIQEFTFNETSNQMESTDGNVVIGYPTALGVFVTSLSSSDWFLSSATMGGEILTKFNALNTELGLSGERLRYAWLGRSMATRQPSFTFYSFHGAGNYTGSVLLSVKKVVNENSQITIVRTGTYESNGGWYTNNVPTFPIFTESLEGIYNLTTTDSPSELSTVTLTDPNDASRSMVLTLSLVEFP